MMYGFMIFLQSILKKVNNINIILEYFLLGAINKTLGKKEVLFDYLNKS